MGATYAANSSNVTLEAFDITEDLIGRFIFLGGAWHKIVSISEDDSTIGIEDTMEESGSELTKIVTMNEITVTGTLMMLNKLSVDYYPIIV